MWFLPKDYVGVHTRVQKFHDKYKNWQVTTDFTTVGDIISFKATVVLDVTAEHTRTFTWSSLWDINKEKAFEKLETVAVWRALAFAWFDIKDWIASWDEMFRFKKNTEEKEEEKHKCKKCGKEVMVSPFKWKFGMCFKCWECGEFSWTNPVYEWDNLSESPGWDTNWPNK